MIGPSARVGFLPANLLSVTLPWVELVVGLLLVTGLWRREAAAVAGAMLVMFLAGIGIATAQGVDIANCGCFSVTEHGRTPGFVLVLQDVGLLAACSVLAFFPARSRERAASAEPAAAH